ncbi:MULTISPECIES: biotin--[acetyl-CoA-carboxylase] ligase [unclassified Helicobacter]|uniref:biotin--[acetyl-CoA-carboxylase] ligase n=1 Tax=unclassified Helicobacter TaxID=2593540 RepID=UPI000CF1C0A7|nr:MULTISPECIES: biotin--[acetyl-CoA-carboxylase] ligase [unclassified Helicobacter]
MEIVFFDTLESTQTFLLQKLQENICVVALKQTNGIGSRGNTWEGVESGLYFSFCLSCASLPKDLKIQSASIFFGYLFKEILCEEGFDIWLKWPNDLYFGESKIGGVIVNYKQDKVVCGIGLNFRSKKFANLGIELDKKKLLNKFFEKLKNTLEWKQVFRKYKLEFYRSSKFSFHQQQNQLSLSNAQLLEDGSICVDEKIFYSLR